MRWPGNWPNRLCLKPFIAAPGNPGIAEHASLAGVDINDHAAVVAFCQELKIELVVVGPEAPLVAGIADALIAAGIKVFGPTAAAARLEGSKGFTKDLCADYDIPTATYGRFNNAPKAKAHVRQVGAPIVIKADGIAAGKGVVVAMTLQEALDAVDACFEGAFGAAGAEVVVEEFLEGEEASFFCLCDGKMAIPFGTAQDHKRVGDGDEGPNTGGMGAYSPASIVTPELTAQVMREIIDPTMRGMAEKGCPFTGVLYAGLMLTRDGPKLIEYNTRFGDPECQVLMMRLKDDLLPVLLAAADGDLEGSSPRWSADKALTVVMAADGYPETPLKGTIIRGIGAADLQAHVKVFPRWHRAAGQRDCGVRGPCAECDSDGFNRARSAGARLCGRGRHRLAGRLLPNGHRLARNRAGGLSQSARPVGRRSNSMDAVTIGSMP